MALPSLQEYLLSTLSLKVKVRLTLRGLRPLNLFQGGCNKEIKVQIEELLNNDDCVDFENYFLALDKPTESKILI
jgi:hypothetical protein